VLEIGTTATVLPLIGNIKFHPEIPWAFPATLIVLAAFWFYFTGGGYPAATRDMRSNVTRRTLLPWPIWRAAILPMLLSIVAVSSLRLLLPSLLPVDAPKLPFDLTPYPFATVIGLILAVVVSAGIVEEVAFRGYLQKPLEDAYGIVPAVVLTGVAFWYAHIDKVSFSHLPFHLLASVLLGLTVYFTRSLLPAIIGHAAGDALLQPAYIFQKPAFVWSALNARPVWEGHNAATMDRKIGMIWHAVQPSQLLTSGFGHTTAVLFWVFVASSLLSGLALANLARVSRVAYGAGADRAV
jgi:membrane protease YdiL (CAAX protease family)